MKTFCRRDKLLLSADLRPTLAPTKISRVCHAPSASLLFAVGDRGERATEEREARGPPTAPMRLTRSLRAGNREVNNLRSFGFPFRPRFVSSRHEFFGFVSPAIKSGIVTISGPKKSERVPRRIKQRRRRRGGQIVAVSVLQWESQNRGQSASPSSLFLSP